MGLGGGSARAGARKDHKGRTSRQVSGSFEGELNGGSNNKRAFGADSGGDVDWDQVFRAINDQTAPNTAAGFDRPPPLLDGEILAREIPPPLGLAFDNVELDAPGPSRRPAAAAAPPFRLPDPDFGHGRAEASGSQFPQQARVLTDQHDTIDPWPASAAGQGFDYPLIEPDFRQSLSRPETPLLSSFARPFPDRSHSLPTFGDSLDRPAETNTSLHGAFGLVDAQLRQQQWQQQQLRYQADLQSNTNSGYYSPIQEMPPTAASASSSAGYFPVEPSPPYALGSPLNATIPGGPISNRTTKHQMFQETYPPGPGPSSSTSAFTANPRPRSQSAMFPPPPGRTPRRQDSLAGINPALTGKRLTPTYLNFPLDGYHLEKAKNTRIRQSKVSRADLNQVNPSGPSSLNPSPVQTPMSNPTSGEDSEDKRVRNTVASAKFRAKKKEQVATVQRTIIELEEQQATLQADVASLRHENGLLKEMVQMKFGTKMPDD